MRHHTSYYGMFTLILTLLIFSFSCGKDSSTNPDSGGDNQADLTFVTIPGGTFEMGNYENDPNGYPDEKPVHTVTVSGFDMTTTEITNGQYAAYLTSALESGYITATINSVTGKTGDYSGEEYLDLDSTYSLREISYSSGAFMVDSDAENRPVNEVSWYGAKAFADYYGLALPREAEWEYACRGGKQHKYGTDDGTLNDSNANYNENVGNTTYVGNYPSNPYGLYDMSGNIWEWCCDVFDDYTSAGVTDPLGPSVGPHRVGRGGAWNYESKLCRSAGRCRFEPTSTFFFLGFRVVRRP